MTFFLTTREPRVDRAGQKVLIHFKALHFLLDQGQEVYGVEFFKPTVLPNGIESSLEKVGNGNTRDFNRILKGEENACPCPVFWAHG